MRPAAGPAVDRAPQHILMFSPPAVATPPRYRKKFELSRGGLRRPAGRLFFGPFRNGAYARSSPSSGAGFWAST